MLYPGGHLGPHISDENVCWDEKWSLSQAVSWWSVGATGSDKQASFHIFVNMFQELLDKKHCSWCETNK